VSRSHYSRDKLKTVQIYGEKVAIDVNTDGKFSAKVGLDFCQADTLAELMVKLRKAGKKTRVTVAVPASLMGYQLFKGENSWNRKFIRTTCVRITMTGINPKTDEIQFRHEDGTKVEQGRWSNRTEFGKPMTDEQIAEYDELYVAHQRAQEKFEAFVDRFKLKDPFEVVRKAITQAADEVTEEPEVEEDPRLAAPRRKRA